MGSYVLGIVDTTAPNSPTHLLKRNGSHQANCPEINWRESSPQAARYQGCPQVCASNRRSEEAPQVQARNCGPQRDQEVPEVYGVANPQAAIPAPREGDCTGFQDRPQVPELWWDCSRTPICVPSTPRGSPSCPRISSSLGGSEERGPEYRIVQYFLCDS